MSAFVRWAQGALVVAAFSVCLGLLVPVVALGSGNAGGLPICAQGVWEGEARCEASVLRTCLRECRWATYHCVAPSAGHLVLRPPLGRCTGPTITQCHEVLGLQCVPIVNSGL
jgi:hypothetical protein